MAISLLKKKRTPLPPPEDDFKEMELWEHLDELRSRLIRSCVYILIGLMAAWVVYPFLEALFLSPLRPVIEKHGWKLVHRTFTGGFMLRLQVSLISGLVIAIPLVTLEAWGFIAPGLTRNERKACRLVFPISIGFFFLGIACGYGLMGVTIDYFAQYIGPGYDLMQDPVVYLTFLVKMVLAFGICFQMPVILMLLAWLGLVNNAGLRSHWRLAVVGCFAVAALATPGGDAVTMLIMSAPLAVLYVGSIFLVGVVERARERYERRLDETDDDG